MTTPQDVAERVRRIYNEGGGTLAWSECDPAEAVGKTVAEVIEQSYGYVLVFTDGTAINYGYRHVYDDSWVECEVLRPESAASKKAHS